MPKTGAYSQINYSATPIQRVEAIWQDLVTDPDYHGFDSNVLDTVQIISATADGNQGHTVFELTIPPKLCNKNGNLHGGAACTLLDSLTSTALHVIARPGFVDQGHVSRTITMTYLRPLPAGTPVRIDCSVVAAGKSTANVSGIIKTLDGKVCVTCVHDKAVFSTRPPPSKL